MKQVITLLLLLVLVQGCSHGLPVELSREVQVFGIQLAGRTDLRELNGEPGKDEPCLHGYERTFKQQGVTIGYRSNGEIRRIMTRNPATAMFGISPGSSEQQARERALKAGFIKKDEYAYRNGSVTLKLLVDEGGRVFGLILETA